MSHSSIVSHNTEKLRNKTNIFGAKKKKTGSSCHGYCCTSTEYGCLKRLRALFELITRLSNAFRPPAEAKQGKMDVNAQLPLLASWKNGSPQSQVYISPPKQKISRMSVRFLRSHPPARPRPLPGKCERWHGQNVRASEC